MCLIFEFFQGQNAVSKKTKVLVNYERIYIGERHAHEQKKTNSGAQTPVSKTKFWFEKITGVVSNFGFETGFEKKKITEEKQQSYAKKE